MKDSIRWIDVKLGTDIQGAQSMNLTDFGDPLTFVKCLNNFH